MLIQAVQPERFLASVMGCKALKEIFHLDQEITPLKDGGSLSLGNRTLSFMETRMRTGRTACSVIWSTNRFFFGGCLSGCTWLVGRFDDEVDPAILLYEAANL